MKNRVRTFIQDFARFTAKYGIPPLTREMLGMGGPKMTSTAVVQYMLTNQASAYFVQAGQPGTARSWRINAPAIPHNLRMFVPALMKFDVIYIDEQSELNRDCLIELFAPMNGIYVLDASRIKSIALRNDGSNYALITPDNHLFLVGVAVRWAVYRPEWVEYEFNHRGES